jgi:hypothetical protein
LSAVVVDPRRRFRRNILVALLGVFGLVAITVAVTCARFYREATALPDWYVEAEAESVGDAEGADEAPESTLAPQDGWAVVPEPVEVAEVSEAVNEPAKKKKAKPRQHELRGFHRRTKSTDAWRPAFRASRATFEDGQLEGGVVLDLSRVEVDALPGGERRLLQRLRTAFPGLAHSDIYVGLETEPVSDRDGFLKLGPETTFRVGNLRYDIATVARRLGVKEADLRREIDREIRRLRLRDPDVPLAADEPITDAEKSRI